MVFVIDALIVLGVFVLVVLAWSKLGNSGVRAPSILGRWTRKHDIVIDLRPGKATWGRQLGEGATLEQDGQHVSINFRERNSKFNTSLISNIPKENLVDYRPGIETKTGEGMRVIFPDGMITDRDVLKKFNELKSDLNRYKKMIKEANDKLLTIDDPEATKEALLKSKEVLDALTITIQKGQRIADDSTTVRTTGTGELLGNAKTEELRKITKS